MRPFPVVVMEELEDNKVGFLECLKVVGTDQIVFVNVIIMFSSIPVICLAVYQTFRINRQLCLEGMFPLFT